MIGYYFAHEDPREHAAVMSSMDLMGEDDDSCYFEPPVDGWRVFHESGQGRTSAYLLPQQSLVQTHSEILIS
eukprot:scaffold20673_cov78-Skeletonema_dohrnii-CCMP3373.AAC.1